MQEHVFLSVLIVVYVPVVSSSRSSSSSINMHTCTTINKRHVPGSHPGHSNAPPVAAFGQERHPAG